MLRLVSINSELRGRKRGDDMPRPCMGGNATNEWVMSNGGWHMATGLTS
jgi:hypothetical protein